MKRKGRILWKLIKQEDRKRLLEVSSSPPSTGVPLRPNSTSSLFTSAHLHQVYWTRHLSDSVLYCSIFSLVFSKGETQHVLNHSSFGEGQGSSWRVNQVSPKFIILKSLNIVKNRHSFNHIHKHVYQYSTYTSRCYIFIRTLLYTNSNTGAWWIFTVCVRRNHLFHIN